MNRKLTMRFHRHVSGGGHMTAAALGGYLGQRRWDAIRYGDVRRSPAECDCGT